MTAIEELREVYAYLRVNIQDAECQADTDYLLKNLPDIIRKCAAVCEELRDEDGKDRIADDKYIVGRSTGAGLCALRILSALEPEGK